MSKIIIFQRKVDNNRAHFKHLMRVVPARSVHFEEIEHLILC